MIQLKNLFSRRWWLTTLFVMAGVVFMVWLGIWQLDRRQQRREFNDTVISRWQPAPIKLAAGNTAVSLDELEFRRVAIAGRFDYDNQIALKNQIWHQQPGIELVTPLVFDDNRAILVARGWIPSQQADPAEWGQFNEADEATIIGRAHESQLMPSGEIPTVPDAAQQAWFRINIDAIQPQMPYELLPFFLLQLPEEGRAYDAVPVRVDRNPLAELRDPIMHTSYAVQWFMFALILGFGYTQFVVWQERREKRLRAEAADDTVTDAQPALDLSPEMTATPTSAASSVTE